MEGEAMDSKDETETDLARRFAMQTVEDSLRTLAANILRTIRGAGSPHAILPQAQALIEAALSHREQTGQFPASEDIGKALDIDTPDDKLDQMSPETEASVTARERMIHGALQIAASRLLEQRPQEAAGDTELREGIEDFEAAREERRKRSAAQQQAPRNPLPPRRR
jgi:hypothetical protein